MEVKPEQARCYARVLVEVFLDGGPHRGLDLGARRRVETGPKTSLGVDREGEEEEEEEAREGHHKGDDPRASCHLCCLTLYCIALGVFIYIGALSYWRAKALRVEPLRG